MTPTVAAFLAVAEAVFARRGAPPPADRMTWLAGDLRDFLDHAGARTRFFLSLLAWAVSLLAPLLVLRVGPLGKLPLPLRARALARLEAWVPAPLLAVKGLLCLLYYEHPGAAREVGFDGACLVPAAAPARGERA